MMNYPMEFKINGQATSGIETQWSSDVPDFNRKIELAIPPEFGGPGNGFSPEDLYALALQNCFIATFKVFAEKSRLKFNHLEAKSKLFVDRNEKGQPWMARFNLDIRLTGVEQSDNAKRLLEKTSQSCMILNSVYTEKTFNFVIEA